MLTAFALVIVLSVCGMLSVVGLAVSGRWQPQAMRESMSMFQHNYVLSLGDYYLANGRSWDGIEQRFEPPVGWPSGMLDYALIDVRGQVVASNDPSVPLGLDVSTRLRGRGIPVEAHGQRIGTLVLLSTLRDTIDLPKLPDAPVSPERPLARPVTGIVWSFVRGFLIAALVLGGTLLLLATIFAQRISHPLRTLTAAAQQLAGGRLDVRVRPAPIREIDQLTQAFNRMAESLSAADRQRRQMTADIAHELRTPLTIIKGRLEGLQDGVYDATPEELERLLAETALLERLIEDLRVLALAEAGQLPLYREAIDPRDLLEAARGAFAGQAAAQHIALTVDLPGDLPPVDVDPQRMAQVLSNLVANALRYTPEGGSIALRASVECRVLSAEFATTSTDTQHSKFKTQNCVLLTVTDTGQGIAAADLPQIFDRFYRADRSRTRSSGGAGLGLAIAKQIVLAHGGAIWATSTEGQGTTVHIALPVG